MKVVIAYALVIIGLTQLVGMLVGGAISLPIAMLLPYSVKPRVVPLLEFFHGAAALAASPDRAVPQLRLHPNPRRRVA